MRLNCPFFRFSFLLAFVLASLLSGESHAANFTVTVFDLKNNVHKNKTINVTLQGIDANDGFVPIPLLPSFSNGQFNLAEKDIPSTVRALTMTFTGDKLKTTTLARLRVPAEPGKEINIEIVMPVDLEDHSDAHTYIDPGFDPGYRCRWFRLWRR